MEKLILTLRDMRKKMVHAIKSFTRVERGVFIVLFLTMTVGVIGMVSTLNQRFTEPQPSRGGTHIEGIIGSPRFINPVLASSAADKDMVKLVYSGLMRATKNALTPDLAETVRVSDDAQIYTFVIREDAKFHDGTSVTADDVVFTIEKIQDSSLESPLRVAWQGVAVEKIDSQTVQFFLNEPYAGFLQNATVGILPQHLWGVLNNEQFTFIDLNIKAVGSGPYRIKTIDQNRVGIPERITLRSFKKFTLGQPFLRKIVIRFFANEEALLAAFTKHDIDAVYAIDPEDAVSFINRKNIIIHEQPLPRIFGMFFNQNQAPIFLDHDIIEAFSIAINKEALIKRTLFGFGTAIEGPLPPTAPGYVGPKQKNRVLEERLEQANTLLEKSGWLLNEEVGTRSKDGIPLAFSLATDSTPELKEAAKIIKNRLEEIGVTVTVQVFETGNLEQDIIRQRNYDALLFGQALNHDSDLFTFWHSSQRNDPGLNIASFTDGTVDTLLSEALRTPEASDRAVLYREFEDIVLKKASAIFIYSPHFLYLSRGNLEGVTLNSLSTAADRFTMVHQWYTETQRLWQPFIRFY